MRKECQHQPAYWKQNQLLGTCVCVYDKHQSGCRFTHFRDATIVYDSLMGEAAKRLQVNISQVVVSRLVAVLTNAYFYALIRPRAPARSCKGGKDRVVTVTITPLNP